MSKGTAIVLKFGATPEQVVAAVRTKYKTQRATAAGWHGTAVVNVAAEADKKDGKTYIVKGIKNGFQVFGYIGEIVDAVKTTAGKFVAAE